MMASAENAADSGDVITDAEGAQRERERVGPRTNPHGRGRSGRVRQLAFERVQLGAQDEPAASDHPIDRSPDETFIVARPQREKRNRVDVCGHLLLSALGARALEARDSAFGIRGSGLGLALGVCISAAGLSSKVDLEQPRLALALSP
jgi:hypothetical protein